MQPLGASLAVRTPRAPDLGRQSPSAAAAAADWSWPATPRTPRTPRSQHVITCSSSSSSSAGAAPSPRLSRRRWTTPHSLAAAAEPAAPLSPRTPPPPPPDGGAAQAEAQQEQQQQQQKAVYDCVDLATQSLAVNLTLEEYRATLQAASCASPAPAADAAAPAAAAGGAALSHLSLSSADLDAMGLCSHCRYPCYLSGMPACEASRYLQMWDADAALKPRGFDAAAGLRLRGVADIAAVSSGGRANGRWKPDNQDSFLVVPTASASPAASASGSGSWSDGEPAAAAAAIGVFDGHGRLGGEASRTVRAAFAEQLAALSPGDAAAAAAAGLPGAAALLDGCFAAAEAALEAAGRDWSKSGCTAVLALLDRDSVSVAWAGDSRAVLGVVDTTGALLGSLASQGSLSSQGSLDDPPPSPGSPAASSSASGPGLPAAGGAPPLCAAVPLTEDHKPDRPGERARITAAGGRVTRLATDRFGNPAGPFRVFVPNAWSPGLALSRAFGDTLASTVGVTSKPEVTVLPLPSPPAPAPPTPALASNIVELPAAAAAASRPLSNASAASCCSLEGGVEGEGGLGLGLGAPPGASERHVLIVASDGLWEWIDNATAVGIAATAGTADDAAHALVEAAQKQWAVRYRGRNCDDITVVVAFLDR